MLTTTIASATIATPRKALIEIASRRTTIAGIQYIVADCLGTHIVTINNGYIGCSCGLDRLFIVCPHLLMVEAQEKAYVEEAARRAAYTELFGIY